MMEPSSSTRPSPSCSTVAWGRSSRHCVSRSPVNTTRRRWRSSASSTTRSMMRDRSSLSAREIDDARGSGLFKLGSGLFKLAVLGKKREVQHVVCVERAFRWKDSDRKACLLTGRERRSDIGEMHRLRHIAPQARAALNNLCDVVALLPYGCPPTAAAQARLEFPF